MCSLNNAKNSCPDRWLAAKITTLEAEKANPNVTKLYKAEQKRRKDAAASEKKKKTQGTKQLWKPLNTAITEEMTDAQIVALPEAKLASIVWKAWLRDADKRVEPDQSECRQVLVSK